MSTSIKAHEQECLALLCKIEKDRKLKAHTTCARKFVAKRARELRNLASSVNYGGKQLSCY